MSVPTSNIAHRLAEYFLVVGCGEDFVPIPGQESINPLELAFQGEVIDRFPQEDHPDTPFPPGIAMFCLPEGVRLTLSPPLPTFHSFASTIGSGDRLYGACLHFFEPMSPESIERAKLASQTNAEKVISETESTEKENVKASDILLEASRNGSTHSDEDDDEVFFDAESEHEENADDKTENDTESSVNNTINLEELVATPSAGEVWYAPKCICILSQWAFLGAMRSYLTQLYRISLTPSRVPIERILSNFMREVPVPPRGRIRVQFTIASSTISLTRAPLNDPLADASSGFPLKNLFQCLSVEKVIILFECLLLERRIVLLSSAYSLLTNIAESLMTLMYPFKWQHVYIPLLPEALLDFLNAPMPFLIGTHKSFVRSFSDLPESVVVVDLDTQAVLVNGRPPRLPDRARSKLVNALKDVRKWQEALWKLSSPTAQGSSGAIAKRDLAFSNAPPPDEIDLHSELKISGAALEDRNVRRAFFRVFVSMFRRYREYLVFPTQEVPYPPSLFRGEDFIQDMPNSSHRFLIEFLTTQAFTRFIEDRVFPGIDDKDVLYFDESIIEKMNRSKFTKHRPTPFLDQTDTEISTTFVAPSPDLSNLNSRTFACSVFPRLDASLFTEPRVVKSLLKSDMVRHRSSSLQRDRWLHHSAVENLPAKSAIKTVYSLWFIVFTVIASGKKRPKLLSRAFDVLERLHNENVMPDISVFRHLIDACGQCSCPDKALKFLEHLQRFGLVPDANIYSALFTAFSTNGDLSHAYHTLGRLKRSAEKRQLNASWLRDKSEGEACDPALSASRCVAKFESAFPGLTIETDDTCPDCNTLVRDQFIRSGWKSDANDYTTKCPKCPSRFVARFSIRHAADKADGNTDAVWCEYLSPNVLKKEVETLVRDVDGEYLCSRQFRRRSPTVFWNLAWHMSNLNLPLSFMIPWVHNQDTTVATLPPTAAGSPSPCERGRVQLALQKSDGSGEIDVALLPDQLP